MNTVYKAGKKLLYKKSTVQPLIRYDIDAAIIFSDILLIPYAIGQKVSLRKKNGPELSEIDLKIIKDISKSDGETSVKLIIDKDNHLFSFYLKDKRKVDNKLLNSLNLVKNLVT